MKFEIKQQNLMNLWKQRNFAYVVSLGILLVNIFLAAKLFVSEERWVLIPQFDPEHKVEISGTHYSDDYLTEWGCSLVSDLLTVNPASVDRKSKRFLEVAATSFGGLKKSVQSKARRIKEEQLSTVFYPKTVTLDRSRKEVYVEGEFLTYFGRDKAPVSQHKRFILTYTRGIHGVILVSDFKEDRENA